jgi:hypothetical protein
VAEYLPIYKPGQAITLKASATITGGQLVEVSGSGTVGPAGAASTKVVGHAAFDAVTNDYVTIYTPGIVQHGTAAGAITAGAVVQAGAAGTIASGTTAPIGIALTTAADTADVRYLQSK